MMSSFFKISEYLYRPQTKFAKVMFLQVSVCPHGGYACVVAPRGVCVVAAGGRGHAWLLLRGHVWLLRGGACVVALGGCAWLLGGACVVAPGGMHGYSQVGACVVALQGIHAWDMTRYRDTINEWAVRILLECILVFEYHDQSGRQ